VIVRKLPKEWITVAHLTVMIAKATAPILDPVQIVKDHTIQKMVIRQDLLEDRAQEAEVILDDSVAEVIVEAALAAAQERSILDMARQRRSAQSALDHQCHLVVVMWAIARTHPLAVVWEFLVYQSTLKNETLKKFFQSMAQ